MVENSDKSKRYVHARDISGIVVTGNVSGDVTQDGGLSPERPTETSPAEDTPVWRAFVRIGIIVGIIAGLAAIAGVILQITS